MIIQTGGYDLNVLKFAPHLDISYEEIDRIIGVLDQVLQKLSLMLSSQSVPEGGVN
jgi:4-aminobutyrate aminotransferase / (S)-3-amino-2-methylpropionate transaminase / 5-aminovalerate transaminase